MAAGLGFKTFTTGEVLTAADTNGYLMQGVLVFASSAARASAITSPQEGQYSYLKDTNSTEYYDGAAWIAAPIGDITGVTAGTGISGGGTSGTVTVSIDTAVTADLTTAQTMTNKTLTTPKISNYTTNGDLVYGTGSSVITRLGIGSTSQVLTVTGGVPVWATPASGGGLTLINTGGTTLTGASINIASIPATYKDLKIYIVNFKPATDNAYLAIQFNGDSTANRHWYQGSFTAAPAKTYDSTFGAISYGQDNTATSTALIEVDIAQYANTSIWKMYEAYSIENNATTATNLNMMVNMGGYNQTAAISSLTFLTNGGNLTSGTVYIYGVN